MRYTHKLGAGIGALLLTGGIGAVVGLSQAGATPTTTVVTPAAHFSSLTSTDPGPTADPGPDVQQGGNTQVGDQTTPDTPGATAEKPDGAESPEKAGTETDGPGGHQDPPGSAGADTQQ